MTNREFFLQHSAAEFPRFLGVLEAAPADQLECALDLTQGCPDNLAEVGARYAEAAPRYGMAFFLDA